MLGLAPAAGEGAAPGVVVDMRVDGVGGDGDVGDDSDGRCLTRAGIPMAKAITATSATAPTMSAIVMRRLISPALVGVGCRGCGGTGFAGESSRGGIASAAGVALGADAVGAEVVGTPAESICSFRACAKSEQRLNRSSGRLARPMASTGSSLARSGRLSASAGRPPIGEVISLRACRSGFRCRGTSSRARRR